MTPSTLVLFSPFFVLLRYLAQISIRYILSMFNTELGESIGIQLHNVGLYSATDKKEYIDIISPFSRLYLINKGSGSISTGDDHIYLEEGYLYLIPSYTFCTYKFSHDIRQYYIHFSTHMSSGLNVFDHFSYHKQVKAHTFDLHIIQKLLSLHPDIKLPAHNPHIYQKKEWMSRKVPYSSISHFMESRGIIEQLLSRFLFREPVQDHALLLSRANLKQVLMYVQNNLHNDFSIGELAEMACLSKDHFTRVFKSVTGYPPVEYVIRKRIEKAQFLLLTTNYSQNRIIEETGFKSLSYFSKIFKKHTRISPGKFRKQT